MRDEDYIPASKRMADFCSAESLDMSHAVADDVMRELAEALREFLPCECIWCENPEYRGPCSAARDAGKALARYDALTKEANDD